jgi:general stress protein 26
MEVSRFEAIQKLFIERIQTAVYCNMATVDRRGRPRSRVIHPIWEGQIGWVISWPKSHKSKHLAKNSFVSLAYIQNSKKPVYIDAQAEWVESVIEKQRIWELHQTTPAPLGFDPKPYYSGIEDQYFGLLKFTPWRIELGNLGAEAMIWRD